MNFTVSEEQLIHKKERSYFWLALGASLITYLFMFVTGIGIMFILISITVLFFLHALMMGYIRSNGVKLTQNQFPEVSKKVEDLCVKMNLPTVPDVYVLESGGVLNAFATRFFGKNMIILYSEIFDLIERNAEDELTFIVAHELAHIKRKHISKQILILPAMFIPFIGKAYSRACEYTCDRYAAYYTQNPEAAKNSLTILAIGKNLFRRVNRAEYLAQISRENSFFVWLSEKISTHPSLPKRIQEIASLAGEPVLKYKQNKLAKIILIFTILVLSSLTVIGGIYAVNNNDFAEFFASIPLIEEPSRLINAIVENDLNKVNTLLMDGEDPNVQDFEGWSALHWAVQNNDREIVEAVLNAGANPNLEDFYNKTPLMNAIELGNIDIMKLLLDNGADPNHQDYDGWTPLIYSASYGNKEAVQLLLGIGVDPLVQDNENLTALMHAIKNNNQEIAQLLRYSDL